MYAICPKVKWESILKMNYEPKYITIRGKGPILKELKTAAKKAKKIYLAADPDREGEAIAWHLAHSLDVDINSDCRVVFNEITKDAIKESFKHPQTNQYGSWLMPSRQEESWIGWSAITSARFLWKKVKKGLSAGRVQSVAVRLIIDREKEIKDFDTGRILDNHGRFPKRKRTV